MRIAVIRVAPRDIRASTSSQSSRSRFAVKISTSPSTTSSRDDTSLDLEADLRKILIFRLSPHQGCRRFGSSHARRLNDA
jgi:hypothetical protein